MREIPVRFEPRRLADWINPRRAKKAHSLIDKIYNWKNLAMAWKRVKSNQGAGGLDGESIEAFEEQLAERLSRMHEELRTDRYEPLPVRRKLIPKNGKPGEHRVLGIPTVYDRVCQQALLNRLEPIFEPVFDEANFGYRRGLSTQDALRKVWREVEAGAEWIVDADLKDYFGSVEHEKLLALVAQRVSDGRVLRLIEAMLKAGSFGEGRLFPTERGTPQGGVASPLLSNILLTPFDWEMRCRGYQLTRYADDWVITCTSAQQARAALATANKVLEKLGVQINPQKTRIVHVRSGFEFLGFLIKRGSRPMCLPAHMIKNTQAGALYAYPKRTSIRRFKDRVRLRTRRKAPVSTEQLIEDINPLLRGWGMHYRRAHVRRLFWRLDRWIVRRLWSHRFKRWRCRRAGRELPHTTLYRELGLVSLTDLIPSVARRKRASS